MMYWNFLKYKYLKNKGGLSQKLLSLGGIRKIYKKSSESHNKTKHVIREMIPFHPSKMYEFPLH